MMLLIGKDGEKNQRWQQGLLSLDEYQVLLSKRCDFSGMPLNALHLKNLVLPICSRFPGFKYKLDLILSSFGGN